MKTATRLVFSVISALLLTAGFARAAEQFDPVTIDTRLATVEQHSNLLPDPGSPCVGGQDSENPN
jgi:hypothetical protein